MSGTIERPESMRERNKVSKFLHAFGAVKLLRERAWSRAAFIEYNILSTYQVDALLRWAIFLKREQDIKWLTKRMKEREVIDMADSLQIFSGHITATDLHELYNSRNAIVHRFLITDIDYELSKRMSGYYEPAIQQLLKIVQKIEKEKLKSVTVTDLPEAIDEEVVVTDFHKSVMQKIGVDMGRLDKVRSHKWTDIEDVVEYASRKGFLILCRNCKHPKVQHVYFDDERHPKAMNLGKCRSEQCECNSFDPDRDLSDNG